MKNKKTGAILVVDDNESWRELFVTILKDDGHDVVSAGSFQEAKDLLKSNRFDIAIIDMRLVDTTIYNIQGMTLLKEAKEKYTLMKAIIFTGFPDTEQKNKAIDFYHADGYFEKVPEGKPLDIDKFSQLIFGLMQV